jgi:hypothetical protein
LSRPSSTLRKHIAEIAARLPEPVRVSPNIFFENEEQDDESIPIEEDLLARLDRCVSARESIGGLRWYEHPNLYLRNAALTPADVPALEVLAQRWIDAEWYKQHPEETDRSWAPMHAIRGLAHL